MKSKLIHNKKGAGLFGGIGGFLGIGARRRARKQLNKNVDEFKNLDLPTLDQLSPEFVGNLVSDAENIDPRFREVQGSVVDRLLEMSSQEGIDAQTQSQIDDIQRQEAARAKGAREAILQNQAARGNQSSNLSALAQLQAGQAAADNTARRNTQVLGQQGQRNIDALLNAGTLSGQVRSQDLNRSRAIDSINQFNNQLRQNNLNNRANANQQVFNNQFDVQKAIANSRAGIAQNENAAADRGANIFGSVLGAGAKIFGGGGA